MCRLLFIVGLAALAVGFAACGASSGSTSSSVATPTATTAVVTTLAGKAGVAGAADGSGAAARFNCPEDIVADKAGNLYVTDFNNSTIRKITPSGVVSTFAGKAGAFASRDGVGADARFGQPLSIAIDADGNLYVEELDWSTIRKITPAGVVTTLAVRVGTPGETRAAGALAVDRAGNLYDVSNGTLLKITPAGKKTILAGTPGVFGCADGPGAAAKFSDWCGAIVTDTAGNIYRTDSKYDVIQKVTPSGVVTTLAGKAGVAGDADGMGAAARFNEPDGICVDDAGDLYVAEYNNSDIRKITPAGQVTTIAGAYGSVGSADGSGAHASFYGPTGIVWAPNGDLYVCDSQNDTIRKLTFGR
jgi:sugar lactone lactonase YvrE